MDTKLRILHLSLAALLGLVGFSSSAVASEFHFETAHTIVTGELPAGGSDVFTFKAGTAQCTIATYKGTVSGATTSELTVGPSFGFATCTAFGFVNESIDVPGTNAPAGPNGGCDYRFTPSTASSQLHIVCGPGEYITVTSFNCDVRIGSQTATGITYTNGGTGTGRDITLNTNITGLTYTQVSTNFPGCATGTFTDGKFVGKTTLKGTTTEGGGIGIWHE
jgi:hypothetical protein